MLKKCIDDLRKFNRLPPYDTPSNYVAGDGYFANWLEEEYPQEVLEEAQEVISKEARAFDRLRQEFVSRQR